MNKMESKNNPKPISKNNYIIIQIAAFISVYKQNMKGVVRLQFWLNPQNGISIEVSNNNYITSGHSKYNNHTFASFMCICKCYYNITNNIILPTRTSSSIHSPNATHGNCRSRTTPPTSISSHHWSHHTPVSSERGSSKTPSILIYMT